MARALWKDPETSFGPFRIKSTGVQHPGPGLREAGKPQGGDGDL